LTFVARWAALSIGVGAAWFAVALTASALDYLAAQVTHPKPFAIMPEFAPGISAGVLAVLLVMMLEFGLLRVGAASNVDAADLAAERMAAWIVAAGLVVINLVLAVAVDMATGISVIAAWALRSLGAVALYTGFVIFLYAMASMNIQRRRLSDGG
jgi:hypothetical protein